MKIETWKLEVILGLAFLTFTVVLTVKTLEAIPTQAEIKTTIGGIIK